MVVYLIGLIYELRNRNCDRIWWHMDVWLWKVNGVCENIPFSVDHKLVRDNILKSEFKICVDFTIDIQVLLTIQILQERGKTLETCRSCLNVKQQTILEVKKNKNTIGELLYALHRKCKIVSLVIDGCSWNNSIFYCFKIVLLSESCDLR